MAYLDATRTASALKVERRTIQAQGAAGVYTAEVDLPAGAMVHDIIVHAVALWTAGTSAALIVGDDADPNGFFDAVDLKATDLLAGESISFSEAGGQAGAYIANSQVAQRYSATARTISFEVTTVGTASSVGTTVCEVLYSAPAADNVEAASYVAS